jgi:ATP-binding cassette subfamily B protein
MNTQANHHAKTTPQFGIISFYKNILAYYKSYPRLVTLLSALILLHTFLLSLIPIITKIIFDDAFINKDSHLFFMLIVSLFFIITFLIIAWIGIDYFSVKLGIKVINHLRLKIFNKIQNLTQLQLREHTQGELLICFNNDMTIVGTVLTQTFWWVASEVLYVLMGACLLFYFNWLMALIVLVLLPLVFFVFQVITKKSNSQFVTKKLMEKNLLNMIREEINFNKIIKVLLLKKFMHKKFNATLHESYKKDFLYTLFSVLSHTVIDSGFIFIRLLIIGLGGYLVFTDYLSVGGFIGFLTMYISFSATVSTLGENFPRLIQAGNCLERIDNIFNIPTNSEHHSLPSLPRFSNKISFNNVDFGYPKEKEIIKNMDLEIFADESVAIVGPSGAGKSTFLDLLLAQAIPTSGSITFDDYDIHQHSIASLFSQVGIVLRDSELFNMSIADNIRMGKLNASLDEIISVAKKVGIYQEITSLREGFNTMMGEGETLLSSGQTQRIVLARALINNPSILILDEAISALDPHNHALIMEILHEQQGSRTTIMVTHNLREVVNVDKIVVLRDGHIEEIGNHHDLLQNKKFYFYLWQKQNGIDISADGDKAFIKPTWLRRIPTFKELSKENLKLLSTEFVIEHVSAGQIIFEENTVGEKFYIIAKGNVEISKCIDGKQVFISVIDKGDFFGEIALLSDLPRTARATAKSDCVLLVLYHNQFHRLFESLSVEAREAISLIAQNRKQSTDLF